jgi:hypothetical protein
VCKENLAQAKERMKVLDLTIANLVTERSKSIATKKALQKQVKVF